MNRQSVPYTHDLAKVLGLLQKPGLLLASTKPDGTSNTMTIGWGYVGFSWGKPIWVVMVRPSRYTYEFIEASQSFTVNVPTPEMTQWVGVCGTQSGRDLDKFGEYGMTVTPGQTVEAVTIDACPMVYECKVVHHNDVLPANLDVGLEQRSYGGADYHRYYYGEISGVYAAS